MDMILDQCKFHNSNPYCFNNMMVLQEKSVQNFYCLSRRDSRRINL